MQYLSRAEVLIAQYADAADDVLSERLADIRASVRLCDWAGCPAPVGCEDHLHSTAYHSADCWCGRTEADCEME